MGVVIDPTLIKYRNLLEAGDIEAKELALKIMKHALMESDPYIAVKKVLHLKGRELLVFNESFKIVGKVYVISVGKAACPMAKAVEEVLGDLITEGVAVTNYGYGEELRKLKVIEAGHPLPDENSVKAAEAGLRIADSVGPKDTLIFLVSGGGSAVFALPEEGISLRDKVKTIELLLKCGARIQEINAVRKHISRVKGGKLAKHVKGTLIGLIISDVVGDSLDAVASGPTVKDSTTFRDAYRVLRNCSVINDVPESVRKYVEAGLRNEVEETLKKDLPNVRNFMISGGAQACEAAAEEASHLGLKPYILTTTLEGEAKDAGIVMASVVEEVRRKGRPFEPPTVMIACGETTVTIRGESRLGGPNQELVLSASRKLKGLRGVALLAVDTDGTDGPTDAAGGVVDSYTAEVLEEKGLDIDYFLQIHDSYEALRKANALLITGPTRTNVNSLVVAVVLKHEPMDMVRQYPSSYFII